MEASAVSSPTMGATPAQSGVEFRVWAPAPERVEVELLNPNKRVPMQRDDAGVWSATVPEARVGTRYRFVLNGDAKRPDPYSRYQPEGVHGPSEVVDPNAFTWHDQIWPGVRIQGLVIYQLHVGTATPEGTLDSLIGQLPRLKSLGIDAVQLLPLGEFPGSRNWGYDGVDLFAVEHAYGGPLALKRLVDAAHQTGLGVIIDVIYNHLGPDGNYLRDFSPHYFTDHYHTPWGDAVNYDDASRSWVRRMMVDNARYWIREYHADGLRLDATHAIYDSSPRHILAEITAGARAEAGQKSIVLIAETGENDVRYLKSAEEGGYGFDAVYADDFHHSLRRYLAGDHEGYYAHFEGTLEEVARCIEEGWLRRGTPARDRPAWQFLYVLQNHDQIGNRAFGERLHHQIGVERFAAASALLLFLPYTPMLFMGQEFAASSPFQFFTDHNPELGKLVTEGRRREFKAFSNFADPATREKIPDPQAESTFLRSKLPLSELDQLPGSALNRWYTDLLRLRHTDPVLRDQSRDRMRARPLTDDVLAVHRWLGSDERLLIVNFGSGAYAVTEFGAGWHLMLEASDEVGVRIERERVTIPPATAAIIGRSGGK
jgi:maltooligosyltrehalose trehalohydrolase